jgi:hypothetical protein
MPMGFSLGTKLQHRFNCLSFIFSEGVFVAAVTLIAFLVREHADCKVRKKSEFNLSKNLKENYFGSLYVETRREYEHKEV